MSIVIPCPHCERQLTLPPELVGRQCRCPECRQVLVANPPPPARPVARTAEAIQPTLAAPAPPPQEPRVAAEPDWQEFAPPERTPTERPNLTQPQSGTPWYLYVPTVLMLVVFGCLVLADFWGKEYLSTTLWGAIGGALVGIAVSIAKLQALSVAVRAVLSGLLVVGSYAVLGILFVVPLIESKPSLASDSWQAFTIPDGSLTIDMPGVPKHHRTNMPNSVNGYHLYIVENLNVNVAFIVAHMEMTEREARRGVSARQRLRDSERGMLRAMPGNKLVSSRQHDYQGHPGIEIVIANPKAKVAVVARSYLVGRHLYVISATGRGFRLDTPDVQRFFDSLVLDVRRAA